MTKTLYSLLICFLLVHISKAQNTGGGVDDQTLHFGFTFQYISSEYKILKKENWKDQFRLEDGSYTDPGLSISSPLSPGFGLGFVSDLRVGTNANLRFTPVLGFASRVLQYEYHGDPHFIKKEVPSTTVDLPLGFKLKSDKRGNFRAYLLAGGKYSLDIISKKKTNDADLVLREKFVKNKSRFFSYEAAIGFDLYFEYFKLSPEIKFSQSLGSILKDNEEPNPYTAPLEKLFLRNFQFSLYFE